MNTHKQSYDPMNPGQIHQEMDSVTKAKAVLSGSDPIFLWGIYRGWANHGKYTTDLDDFYDFHG